ncbi:ribosome-binding factor A [Candidatus Saccharibacteria bacterium]|nr:ribosome-binding factor A [Candidatus Saccharibacteria bacterium]
MSYRIAQINHTILGLLGDRLRLLSQQSDFLITIQEVDTAPDLASCKIYLSFFPTPDKLTIDQFINQARPKLQKTIAQNLFLRKTPKLQLIYDQRPEDLSRIEKILNKYKD